MCAQAHTHTGWVKQRDKIGSVHWINSVGSKVGLPSPVWNWGKLTLGKWFMIDTTFSETQMYGGQ